MIAVDEGGYQLWIRLSDVRICSVVRDEQWDFDPGDIVLVGDAFVLPAPGELWRPETWVGVVRIRRDDLTVLDSGGRWKLVPTSDVDYMVGNTVTANDDAGVLQILQEQPLRHLDNPEDPESLLRQYRPDLSDVAETFDDVGGLEHAIARAKELIEVPLAHAEKLEKIGARPIKGVLFTGPPGSGKTMLARIIAKRSGAEFYEVSGPQIFSKWLGDSEFVLRQIFEHARQQERAIVFFDEIDSVAIRREGDTHEASRRVVAQLLTLMDGFEPHDNVIVIAATNRPQDIDEAIRRPGRFDWEIDFSLPDEAGRAEILRAGASKLGVHGRLPHETVASLSTGWSGAELAAIWSEAALLAAADGRDAVMAEDYLGGFERVAEQREAQRSRRPGVQEEP